MSDTVDVTYSLRGIERVAGAGRLIGLAILELDVAGVVLTLQGVQVRRRADGGLACEAPTFRCPRTGKSLPAVILPDALSAAIAAEVLAAMSATTATALDGPTVARGAPVERVDRLCADSGPWLPRTATLATFGD
jgi:hypothetical protein